MSQNETPLELICITTLFPNKENERHGIFIYNRLKKLAEYHNVKIHVIAPFPLRSKAAFSRDISSTKDSAFTSVSRPRFLSVPIINRYLAFLFIALAALPTAIRLARKHNIQIIDSHFLYPDCVSASLVSRFLDLPFVTTARGSDINFWAEKRFPKFLIKRTLEKAKCNFAVSQKLATKMDLLAPDAMIHVSPNGVDSEVFSFTDTAEKKAKPYLVLSVGNLIPLKGHHLVIDAIARTANTRLEIIGHGPEKENLLSQVQSLKLEDRVQFLDNINQKELAKKYQSAHVLVLASEMEGMPNVILEAMSCGLQVICTPVGDIPEIINTNIGWVVDRNVNAIAQAIIEASEQPKCSKSIGKIAAEQFSWLKTISKYHQIISAP